MSSELENNSNNTNSEIRLNEKLQILKQWFRENPNLPEEIGR